MRRLFALLGLALGIAAVVVVVRLSSELSTTSAAFPGSNGLLTYSSLRAGVDYDLYVTDAAGTSTELLLGCGLYGCYQVAWSADGTKFAYLSIVSPILYPFLYTADADGSNVQTLLPPLLPYTVPVPGRSPAWSPDGSKVAFLRSDSTSDIWIVGPGQVLTQLTSGPAVDTEPAWSPDGAKIAFASNRDGDYEIYIMNANGSAQTRLTFQPGSDVSPNWSPDGTKLAFASERDGNYEIYVMDADGTDQQRITNNASRDDQPVWSPDGTLIAFVSDRDGNTEIYTMATDGTNQTNVSNHPSFDTGPDWQPIPLAPMATSTTAPTVTAGSAATSTPQAVGGVAVDPTASNSPDVRVYAAIAFGAVLAAGTSIFTLAFRLRVP